MSFLRKQSDPNSSPSVFATYLTQSIPFRRKSRQSSTDSNISSETTFSQASTESSSSNPFLRSLTPTPLPPVSSASSVILPPDDKFLHGHQSHIHCAKCSTDLCLTTQIISKGFTGRHGRAFLVQGNPSHVQTHTPALPNTFQNKNIPRNLVTGQHIVSDISCQICGSTLGWKYVEASEESQKYKVGKFILETKRIRIGVSWENEDEDAADLKACNDAVPLPARDLRRLVDSTPVKTEQELEFDSQDEDECEDLFAGVWNPQLAAKRRQRKRERFGRRPVGSGSMRSFGAGSSSTDTLS